MAKRLLSQAGIDYDVIVADQGGQQFAKEHHIQMAPTLLIEEKDGLHQFENVSDISSPKENRNEPEGEVIPSGFLLPKNKAMNLVEVNICI